MTIPFVDLHAQYISIQAKIDQAISDVIAETAFIGGKYVKTFEQEFAKCYGVKHVIACGNGTDSLFILMKMLGIGAGDEVITVANSWISSSETISQVGARPVFVDIDPVYYSIDETLIEEKINARTKALIAVHLQGQVCEMKALGSICKKHNLFLIEDCAQAHFSEFQGVRAGLSGIAGSFSFFPGKNLGAYGDAGCLITNDDLLADRCRMFANHGALIKHQHQIEGINSRMDGLQAAILSAKLPYVEEWTAQRRKHAQTYQYCLKDLQEIILPQVRPFSMHSFHLYVIRAPKRDLLRAYLKEMGIETLIHYPTPLPFLPAYGYLGHKASDFPVAAQLQQEILSLPMYPELTVEMISYVSDHIRKFYGEQNKKAV